METLRPSRAKGVWPFPSGVEASTVAMKQWRPHDLIVPEANPLTPSDFRGPTDF
jgi:hypothetical protein